MRVEDALLGTEARSKKDCCHNMMYVEEHSCPEIPRVHLCAGTLQQGVESLNPCLHQAIKVKAFQYHRIWWLFENVDRLLELMCRVDVKVDS